MMAHALPDGALPDEALAPVSRTIWTIAALGALAIHAAAGVLVFHAMRDTGDELGAPALVIDLDLTSPRRNPTDLPVGPEAEATAAAPAVIEQKTVVEQADLPKAVPTETDNPDLAVTLEGVKKPDKQDPKITAVEAAPSDPSAASEATAVPSVEGAAPSRQSSAPSPGTDRSAVHERVTWEKELAAHFDKFKRYPPDRAMQGATVVVSFALDRMGHMVSSRIVKGSGDASFDQAALDMLQRSDPVPAPPELVAEEGLTFTMPVIFYVKSAN
jgi:protein TonB